MTRYRESELRSSSIYNQNDPWDPPVVFEEFLRNNENIEGKVPALPLSRPHPETRSPPSPKVCARSQDGEGQLAAWRASSVVAGFAPPLNVGLRGGRPPLPL